MKKTLLSLLAVFAVAFTVVSCNNNKEADAYIKVVTEATAKLESVTNMDELNTVIQDLATAAQAYGEKSATLKVSEAKVTEITTATDAYSAKMSELAQKFAQEAAEKAAAEAAAAEVAAAVTEGATK